MQHLEVSGAVRPLYGSLGVKGLRLSRVGEERLDLLHDRTTRGENTLSER